MLKRTFSFLLSVVLVTTLCGAAFAVQDRASTTLNSYNVTCAPGNRAGELRFSYEVWAKDTANSVGVSSIVLYSSGGVYMTTILGSTENGLIETDDLSCIGTYPHTAVPGNSYYGVATVFAQIGDDYDSRVVTTSIVTAPTTSTTPTNP